MKFQYDAQRESYDNFHKVTYLKFNLGACRNPKCLGLYLRKYNKPRAEIQARASRGFWLKWVLIAEFEILQKTNYSENSTMTSLRLYSGACKNPNFLRSNLQKYSEQDLKFRPEVQNNLISNGFFYLLKHYRKNFIAKMLQRLISG